MSLEWKLPCIWCRLGFSDAGVLAAADSAGVLSVQSAAYGCSWVPVFTSAAERKGSESHWITGFDEHHVFCVVCKSANAVPQVRFSEIIRPS